MDITKKRKLSGFTLIELSIVLVIISLIVGGVVGGKSLIDAAKLQSAIHEFNEYKIAYNNFKLQYDAIPGDMRDGYDYFSGVGDCGYDNSTNDWQGCNGNGNALIAASPEGIRAFHHMQLAGLIEGKVERGDGLTALPSERNVPQWGGGREIDGWLFMSNHYMGHESVLSNFFGKTGNWLQLGSEVWWFLDGGVLEPRKAAAIDKKIDDGMPLDGQVAVMNGSDNDNVNNTISPLCVTGGPVYWNRNNISDTTLTYNLEGDSVSCVLHFYLG